MRAPQLLVCFQDDRLPAAEHVEYMIQTSPIRKNKHAEVSIHFSLCLDSVLLHGIWPLVHGRWAPSNLGEA